MNINENAAKRITIRPFCSEEDVSFVIAGQLKLYKEEYGFDTPVWIEYVTNGVHELINKFDDKKDCMYILEHDKVAAGSIAITHENEKTAKLRFFFLEPTVRGMGAGHMLIDLAIDFCKEKRYEHVLLWTMSKLEAARHLYSGKGFYLTESSKNDTWGSTIYVEERWDLDL